MSSFDYSRLEGTQFRRDRVVSLDIAVVGLGALGNEVVRALGLIGPRRVLCIDPDRVEASNLTRSVFYDTGCIGQPKAAALTKALVRRFPDTSWEACESEVADVGWGRLAGVDLIFGCVDRDSARLEMARISTRLAVPVCDGGMDVLRGRVTYFPGKAGACFSCRMPAPRRREMLRDWSSETHPCGAGEADRARSSVPTTAAVTGALQVEIGLRCRFEGVEESSGSEVRLGPKPSFENYAVPLTEGCPFHGDRPKLIPVVGAFADYFGTGQVISWEWPICTLARCQACGFEWPPMIRKARLRHCIKCKSSEVTALSCVTQVRRDSEWSGWNPEDLGLPENHLYTVWET